MHASSPTRGFQDSRLIIHVYAYGKSVIGNVMGPEQNVFPLQSSPDAAKLFGIHIFSILCARSFHVPVFLSSYRLISFKSPKLRDRFSTFEIRNVEP